MIRQGSLIPRAKLFGNPTRAQAQIAPDGHTLSWLAPKDGVLNVWVAPAGDPAAARAITDDRKRGIRFHGWALNGTHILYMQDEGGTEDWHIYAVDVAKGTTQDLTPLAGIAARIEGASLDHPDTIVVGLNDRDKSWHDLWRVHVPTGERELLLENRQELAGVLLDRQLAPRLAVKTRTGEGGRIVYRIVDGKLDQMRIIEHEDDLTTHPIGFTRDGATLYWLSSQARDRAALIAMDWASGSELVLAEHGKADISGVLTNPRSFVVEAAAARHLRREWIVLDEAVRRDLDRLEAELPGEVSIADQSLDNRTWLVVASAAETPATYHLYDRSTGAISELFATRPELSSYRLLPMHGEVVRASDGLELTSYLTLPAEAGSASRPAAPLPMVLLVHGGPWARDDYGFNPAHQWLADRGYAALSVNFRGSTGFGKAFLNAGDLEWGRKMHQDLIDAVDWAVAQGIAQKERVAIMGGSYGGYATLAALTFTPDVFCCGVDIVGPSNLETLLATIPPYWASFFENFARRVGDPRTEQGRALLKERSPVNHCAAIARPLLIAQGANDPRVKQAESDQIVAAMRAKGLPVTYVLYPEEGHGFAVPENRMAFQAIAEAFLARYLGGGMEPIGDDFSGARFEVLQGAGDVPGLEGKATSRA